MVRRALLIGFAIWAGATVALRLAGQNILTTRTALPLYAASFIAMALLVPWICRRIGAHGQARFAAATLLMLPTLTLDAFSCLFFGTIFPNLQPSLAGVFGGWMLLCCAGAVVGVWVRR